MRYMEQIVLRLVKISFFVAAWGISSKLLMKIMAAKKPGLRLYDPEILFPSVLAAALLTKIFMLILNAVITQ